jgi:hypothetical protein
LLSSAACTTTMRYFAQMEAADAIDAEPRMEAERALVDAQRNTQRAEVGLYKLTRSLKAHGFNP